MTLRFAAVGFAHNHIFNQTDMLLAEGAELAWYWGRETERLPEFAARYPAAKRARSVEEILDDPAIELIVCADIPAERAPLGIRAMRAGKHFSTASGK